LDKPQLFVTAPNGIHHKNRKGEQDGHITYWLETKNYEEFKDNWKILPSGF
jgi:hypothetical protein